MKTALEIANAINAAGETYFRDTAKAWVSGDGKASRIYFGRDYVTIEASGEIHNRTRKARSKSIGASAVELVERYAK